MTYIELDKVADELYSFMSDNKLHADVYTGHDDYIAVEINWGDWKHEHLRCKWLASEFFKVKGRRVVIQTEVTEEDGTDCYSAIHRIYLR